MKIDELKDLLFKNSEKKSSEFKRIFHGRGNFYGDFSYLSVDLIDKVLFAVLFEKVDENIEKSIIKILKELFSKKEYEVLILQRRYEEKAPIEILKGELKEKSIALENNLKYEINFSNKNIGIFPDMKIGREFVKEISKDKTVLNLFSYTCAFSVCAISGGAKKSVNVDMSKAALNTGRQNHRINNLDTKKVKFLPYNILKSWSRIKKEGPYDLIIIDPPSFQKGSFAASKDYEKIIKRLDELANKQCTILSCLNAPELDEEFIKKLFLINAPSFYFERRLENLDTFPSLDEQRSLKNLIFKRF